MEPDLSTPANPAKPVASDSGGDRAVPRQGSADVELSPVNSKRELDKDFTQLVEPMFDRMVRFAYFQSGDRDLAASLAQDSVAKLYSMWAGERNRAAIKEGGFGYVSKVIVSAYCDFGRSCSRASQLVVKLSHAAEARLRWAMGGLDIETVWSVRDAVLSLEDHHRALIYLVYYEELSVSAAGRELNLNAQKAHRVHIRALEKLRLILAQ